MKTLLAVLILSTTAYAGTIGVECDPVEHTTEVYYYFIGLPDPQEATTADVPHLNCKPTVIQVRAIVVGVDPQDCLPDTADENCSAWSNTLTVEQPDMTAVGIDPETASRVAGEEYIAIEGLNIPDPIYVRAGTAGQPGYDSMTFTVDENDCHGVIGTLNLAPETQVGETVALTLVDGDLTVLAGTVTVVGAEPVIVPTPQNLRLKP